MSKARYGKPRSRTEMIFLGLFFVVIIGGMLILGFVNGWGSAR